MGGGCCDFCCVGDCCVFDFGGGGSSSGGCSYTPSRNTSDKTAKKIANELANMKESYTKIADDAEKLIIKEINGNMDAFISEIAKINNNVYGGRTLNINIDIIKKNRDDLARSVVGHIGGVVHDRLVMTDAELSLILKEKNDAVRAEKFKNFCDRLIKDAKNTLKEKVKKTVTEQNNIARKEIMSRMDEIDQTMQASIKEFERVKEANEKSIQEKEKLQLELMYKHGLYDFFGKQLDI